MAGLDAVAVLRGGVTAEVSLKGGISGELEIYKAQGITYYTGATEFTPSALQQTIEISGKTATENITINPIPSNYGLITWNGSTLTVS